MVSMYFSIFYPLNLFIIKLISWRNHSFLGLGFYMKHNPNKIILLTSYISSSFDDMKFLTYGLPKHYVTSVKIASPFLQNFWHPFEIRSSWYREDLSQFWCFQQILILIALLQCIPVLLQKNAIVVYFELQKI